ncbi:Cell division and transport-associated protein TolA [Collimonas sp. OK307]|uniref:cell envelope integrity protein TolA n=1 Tax=Collimonas sp. OK307 TaxID=1801620 RepID=UPI0008E16631|nr:cell envelope integrity protein TolA [Collimonas sp. OK307]SFI40999.1 Cell division and transport-associated protein TolA [Collimonas sp. OK307]
MTGNSPYSVPKEPGSIRAIMLAAAVHAALFAFLWFGIHWQSQQPIAVEAEIWSPEIKDAAPTPPEPVPQPTPVPKPEPIVQETAPPPPVVAPPPVPDPEIALEKEKKRKEQERKDLQRQEELEKQKQLQKQQAEEDRKDKLKAEAEQKAAKDKAAAQEKQKQEAAKKAEADAKKKQAAADAAADNKRHADELKRMLGQAVGNGAANSTGTAAQSQGPRGDPGYGQKVGAKIKSNINFNVPEGLAGNPAVEFDVQLLPDGSVASVRLRKSSGVSGFDEAVKRAIERSAPYPKDSKTGSVPSSFIGIHKPKDQ